MIALNGRGWFAADNGTNGVELWNTDGNSLATSIDINPAGSSNPHNFVILNNKLYFIANDN